MWDPMASPSDEIDEEDVLRLDGTSPGETVGNLYRDDGVTPLSMERRLSEMRDILQLNEDRLGRLESTIQDLSKQTNFLPPKLRGLGKKVDELSTSVGDARMRSLLADVAGLGDLAEGALRVLSDDEGDKLTGAEVQRYFNAMATRVEQILEANDLLEIPTDIAFDPTLHNAIDVQPVEDEELDGCIIDVVRRGYRSEHSVLRFAEVTVGRFEGQAQEEGDPADKKSEHSDDISSTYTPFLGASSTAEDSQNLTKRGTKRSSDQPETNDDAADSDDGVEPSSA